MRSEAGYLRFFFAASRSPRVPSPLPLDQLFEEAPVAMLAELKSLAEKFGVGVWFTARTHRDDRLTSDALPENFAPAAGHFETILALEPEGNEIHVSVLKDGATPLGRVRLQLDPGTMLMKNG